MKPPRTPVRPPPPPPVPVDYIPDAGKMVEAPETNEACAATNSIELRRQILDVCVPKNEREWWASKTIQNLELELNSAHKQIVELEQQLKFLKERQQCQATETDQRKSIKPIVCAITTMVIIPFGFWLGGFDFDLRGQVAYTCYVSTLCASGLVYAVLKSEQI